MNAGKSGPRTGAYLALALSAILAGCSGGSSTATKPPVPVIQNINSSTNPSGSVSLPIEINGTGFQGAPGEVIFTQGSISATVTPNAGGWSDTGIIAVISTGNGTSQFTAPGTVAVTVQTSGGTSNAINLILVPTVTFNVNNVTWTTTTPLPSPSTGLRAVAVPGATSGTAFIVVAGGSDLLVNSTAVYSNSLNADGTVSASWTAIPTQPLPSPRAHFGMAEADDGNSLIPLGSRFVYVIAGQQNATDAPGGTNTVFMASVNSTTGAVGAWTQLTNGLPASLVGAAVTLFNGYIYVVGGLTPAGMPSAAVYSAPVNTDGTLGAWVTSTSPYPTPVSFATMFGFALNLYVLDGDDMNSATPDAQTNDGIQTAEFASVHRGIAGPWTSTATTIKNREKHVTWLAFGQVIDAEGIYNGSPGSLELERTTINPDGTLASWNGITSSVNQIGANVYNAAAIVSPLLGSTNAPRFLLLGGQAYATTPPGALSKTVYVNKSP